jgi:FkbM family methyltransferase
MTKLLAQFLVALVNLATGFLGPWRKLTVRARVHDGLAPESAVTVNGTALTLLVPDRTSVYWPRHGFDSEPNTISWIDGFGAGDVFYDIGANIGAYTLYAAKARSVRVVAFEPNPFSYRVLVQNLHLNDVTGRVLPLCLAVGDETGVTALSLNGTEAGSVGHAIAAGGPDGNGNGNGIGLQAMAFRLDDLAEIKGFPAPTQVKIDVDGIEAAILDGARSLLSGPGVKSVLIEMLTHDEAAQARIMSVLGECGLKPADLPDDGSDNRLFTRA